MKIILSYIKKSNTGIDRTESVGGNSTTILNKTYHMNFICVNAHVTPLPYTFITYLSCNKNFSPHQYMHEHTHEFPFVYRYVFRRCTQRSSQEVFYRFFIEENFSLSWEIGRFECRYFLGVYTSFAVQILYL